MSELKRGYKQTEVGVIPEDWDVRPCSAITERIMVGIVIRPAQYYVKQGVPAFRSANIREAGIDESDLVYISDRSNALLAKSQVRAGDVLTVRTGYPGTSAVVPERLAGSNCIDILISRPSKAINPDFLAAWINSPVGKNQVLQNQGGLAQQHFNVGDLRNLTVAIPPVPEQRAIAGVLGDVDALIGALDRLIAKKRNLKQAAMQQLLTGQTRLPGFSEKWGKERLERLSTFITKGSTPTTYGFDWVKDGILFLRSECVAEHGLDLTQSMYISPEAHSVLRRSEIHDGDILITITGNVGRVVYFEAPDRIANINQHIARIRLISDKADARYVFHYLAQPVIRRYYGSITTGQAYPQISLEQVRATDIRLPQREEQSAIASVLSDMDAEVSALEKRRDKTRLLKQGMMQELLTGRIRLS